MSLAKHKTTGEHVAVKTMCKSEIIRLEQVDHIYQECAILGSLSHPFIVFHLNTSTRSASMEYLRMQSTSILLWNSYEEESSSHI